MAKELKRKLLFATIFLLILLNFSAYASLIPNAHATEATSQEKGLSILTNVVGLDLSKYAVTAKEYQQSAISPVVSLQENAAFSLTSTQSKLKILCSFANGNLQMIQVLEDTGVPILTKTQSTIATEMAKNFLGNYQTQTANTLYEQLKSTLNSVDDSQNSTRIIGNSQLEVSTINGYTTFKWTYAPNGILAPSMFIGLGFNHGFLTYFIDNWQLYKIGSANVTLSENGAKALALETASTHNWSLPVDADAFDARKYNTSNICWATLVFDSSFSADKMRDSDPSVLYPVWRFGVALDKWYGNLYGIQVDIWADTGEVRAVQEAWSSITPEEENALAKSSTTLNSTSSGSLTTKMPMGGSSVLCVNYLMWATFSAITTAATGLALFWVVVQKKPQLQKLQKLSAHFRTANNMVHLGSLLKRHNHSVGVIMLCVLTISSMAFFMPVRIAKATPTAAAVVWGSPSFGSYDSDLETSWRKSNTEVAKQNLVAPMIQNLFSQSGYSPSLNHLNYTQPQIIQDLQSYTESASYQRVAVVVFDHGIGRDDCPRDDCSGEFHYMFEDGNGTITGEYGEGQSAPENGVYDNDIYYRVANGKVVFAFINTCLSANITDFEPWNDPPGQGLYPPGGQPPRAFGMPFAWTRGREVHPIDTEGFTIAYMMSDDGYARPDWGSQVYIGFPWGSASLSQMVPFGSSWPYFYWVELFFSAALNTQYPETVNQALDTACIQSWAQPFGSSPLREGFDAYWWMYPDSGNTWHDCTMAVYGNGDIYIQNPPPDSSDPLPTPTLTCLTSPRYVDTPVNFSAVTTDLWGYDVYYTFSWGDGTPRTIIGPCTSNVTAYQAHVYNSPGQYSVSVSAMNSAGYPSAWSSPIDLHVGFSDNFNDNSTDTSKWEKLQMQGASVNETTNQLVVEVDQDSGQVQSGYVTKNAYNIQGLTATIEVTEFDSIDEMILQIGTSKTTNSDPYYESDWYRILKARYDSKVYVQSRANNGAVSTKVATTWMSPTGALAISVEDGIIALYENGNLRYSESYALSSYNCYVYVFTSTLGTRAWGTDKFDNFELSPKRYEFYNTGDDDYGWNRGGANVWQAQTFTVGAIGHTVDSIKLKLFRAGNPGTFTVSIRATDGNGLPNGSDLTSGSVAGTSLPTTAAWFEIAVTQHTLSANTKYAIVCRSSTGDLSNYFAWRCDTSSPSYTSGNRAYSTNSGSTWSNDMNQDFMFEVRG